jgi:hypothetical protein
VIRLRRHFPLLAAATFWLLSVLAVPASASLGAGPEAQGVFEGEVGLVVPTLAPVGGTPGNVVPSAGPRVTRNAGPEAFKKAHPEFAQGQHEIHHSVEWNG